MNKLNKMPVHTTIIMEGTAAEPSKVEHMKVIDTKHGFYIRWKQRIQSFGIKNRNGRIYLGAAMIPSYNADHILELESKNSWFGEAGHPLTDDVKRILTVLPALTSHRVVSHNVNVNYCDGIFETIDDGNGFGAKMARMILQGMIPAMSIRALANMITKPNGDSVIESKAHIVCPDWVILPSHSDAYMDTSANMNEVAQEAATLGNSFIKADPRMITVTESSLLDFISMESSNVKLVSNACELALEGMTLSSNGKSVILREGNFKYVVPLEDRINYAIGDYMSKL